MPRVSRLEAKRKMAFEWFNMGDTDRFRAGLPLDKQKLARHLRVGKTTIQEWEQKYYAERLGKQLHEEEVIRKKRTQPKEEPYDSEKYLNGKTDVVDQALIEACEQNNAQALKIYYQLTKRLIEKQEVTHKLDGDYIARQYFEARRELEATRVDEVSDKSTLFSHPIRLPSGQKQAPNS